MLIEMKIIEYKPEYFACLKNLFCKIYQNNPRLQESDYFEWQFGSSPNAKNNYCFFFTLGENNEIKSFIGYEPIVLSYENNKYNACFIQNWYSISKDASGVMLLMQIVNKFDICFMLDITPEAENIYRKMKWKIMDEFKYCIAVMDATLIIDVLNLENVTDQNKARESESLLRKLSLGGGNVELANCSELNSLDFSSTDSNGLVKDEAWLIWRYSQIPRHNYQVLYLKNDFVIFRTETIKGIISKVKVLHILEWKIESGHGSFMKSLLEICARDNIIMMDFVCSNQKFVEKLEEYGFIDSEKLTVPIPRLFRPICIKDGIKWAVTSKYENMDYSSILLTKGNSDLDRIKL